VYSRCCSCFLNCFCARVRGFCVASTTSCRGLVDGAVVSLCAISTGIWVSVDKKRLEIRDRRLRARSWRPKWIDVRLVGGWQWVDAINWVHSLCRTPNLRTIMMGCGMKWPKQLLRCRRVDPRELLSGLAWPEAVSTLVPIRTVANVGRTQSGEKVHLHTRLSDGKIERWEEL